MNSFYVYLPSNVKCSFHENKISHYFTELGQTLFLEKSWQVALTEVMYKKSWYNINSEQGIRVIDSQGEIFEIENSLIEPGYYTDIKELVKIINDILKEFATHVKLKERFMTNPPSLNYDEKTMKISEICGHDLFTKISYFPVFDFELSCLLGLENSGSNYYHHQKIIKGTSNEVRDIDIDAGVNALYIYSNIVKQSIVGDSFAQLLRISQIPSVSFGTNIHTSFTNPNYIDLARFDIKTIEIDIKDDTGENIKFNSGRVVCVLHFKKI